MKYLKKKLDLVPATFVFSPTEKEWTKYIKKNHSWVKKEQREKLAHGITQIIKEDGNLHLIVCVDFHDNIYEAKGLIVHEISHCVTEIMEHLGINCDEFRSYCLQRLYIDTITFYDEWIEKCLK